MGANPWRGLTEEKPACCLAVMPGLVWWCCMSHTCHQGLHQGLWPLARSPVTLLSWSRPFAVQSLMPS